jgi:alpha-1,6-mannosyltransferase
MRIVQFANFYAPTSGGLRTFVEETGRGYTARGHTRVLVVPGLVDDDEWTDAGRKVTIASPPMFGSDEYRRVRARRRVLGLLDAVAPDVLEINDKMAVTWLSAWARRRGVPTVLVSHERIDAILKSRVPGRLPLVGAANAVNRALRRRVDRVVVASAFSAAEFERAGVRDVVHVPLGVDLATFRPQQANQERDEAELVLVSRLSLEKSPELAIATLRRLWAADLQVRLSVIGEGPLRAHLQALAAAPGRSGREAGLPVRFLGHVSDRHRLAGLIAAADVAVCPSSAETFGLATLEALACGTPVVVPTQGALRELVAHGDGGVVCSPTAEDFAAGVRALLAVPPDKRRAAARAVALAYPWERTVSELLALHSSLAASAAYR